MRVFKYLKLKWYVKSYHYISYDLQSIIKQQYREGTEIKFYFKFSMHLLCMNNDGTQQLLSWNIHKYLNLIGMNGKMIKMSVQKARKEVVQHGYHNKEF